MKGFSIIILDIFKLEAKTGALLVVYKLLIPRNRTTYRLSTTVDKQPNDRSSRLPIPQMPVVF